MAAPQGEPPVTTPATTKPAAPTLERVTPPPSPKTERATEPAAPIAPTNPNQ
jgi:hypothetical protein